MPLAENDCSATYKVLVLGDSSVGKTALLHSLTGRGFSETMVPTVGVDFVRKIFEVDGALIQLVIWDSAGQTRFRSITKAQYKGVQGLLLVYDVTNPTSLETLHYWMKSIQEEIVSPGGGYEPLPFVICGNKADLISKKMISTDQGCKFSDKHMALGYFETSAKTGDNVYTAFHTLAFHITDICQPKLMKSYHPHQLRPFTQRPCPDMTSKKVKKRSKNTRKKLTKDHNLASQIPNNSSHSGNSVYMGANPSWSMTKSNNDQTMNSNSKKTTNNLSIQNGQTCMVTDVKKTLHGGSNGCLSNVFTCCFQNK